MPIDDPAYAQRLNVAASSVGTNRPQLAVTLANSDLSHGEIQAVGGFAKAMQLSVANRLAADSGAKTNYSAQDSNALAGIGEQPVNAKEDTQADSRSWLEKATDAVAGALSNTGNALLHNPVSDRILGTFEWLGNAAHMPFRLLSDGLDQGNNDEVNRQMADQGYDPTSTTSYLAFMFNQSESLYHNLQDVRDNYGDHLVDLATQMQADPTQFQADLEKLDGAAAHDLNATLNSQDFKNAYDAVDRQHISPGRDIARLILPAGDMKQGSFFSEDGGAFTILSGGLDAAYDWYTDPTLILGKTATAVRAADALGRDTGALAKLAGSNKWLRNKRTGLQSMTDQAGIEHLLRTEDGQAVTRVGKGWEQFLSDAKDLRAADAAGDVAKRAGIFRAMSSRYGTLMPLLDEVNGTRVVAEGVSTGGRIDRIAGKYVAKTDAKPIETLDALTEHLVSTNGLLRLNNGMAARRAVLMPGRLSWRAERKAAGDTHKAKVTGRWIDYSKPHDLIPDDAETQILANADNSAAARDGLAQARLVNRSALTTGLRGIRAKAERVSRRFTTMLPQVSAIDLADPNSAKTVEEFARMYLNRGDAAKLASAYSLGDLGARRAVVRGVLEQSFHASGLSRSEAGTAFMERYRGDQALLDTQQYGLGGTSRLKTERGTVEAALYPDQLSDTVQLPSFREMNYLATKFSVHGFAGRTGLANVKAISQSGGMDRLMGTIKLGWITSAAGGLRNALDEVANFAAYGMGKDVLAGRVAYTKATKTIRDERRAASADRIALNKKLGRSYADEHIGSRLMDSVKSHEDATLALERATKAEAARAALPDRLAQRVTDAQAGHASDRANRFRALQDFEDAKAAGLPEEQLAPLRDKAQFWSDAVARSKESIKQHEKAAANPKEALAQLDESFAKQRVLTVGEATRHVTAAQAELKQARLLERAISHRLPYFVRGMADNVNDLLIGSVLGKIMSVLGKDTTVDSDLVRYASELTDPELAAVLQQGIFQAHHADTGLTFASDAGAMDLHHAGLMGRKYAFESRGWGQVEADGGAGLNAWAKTLQLRFADQTSPAHSWLQTVRAMTHDGSTQQEWQAAIQAGRDSLRHYLDTDSEEIRHFLERAEVFHHVGGAPVGKDEALKALAKDTYADKVSEDLTRALASRGKDGIHRDLLDELAAGRVPDRSWLANNVPTTARPEHAIGQLWAPFNPAHEPGQLAQGYTQMLSHAYDKVVTDQINALSRNPLFSALYVQARQNTKGYVDHLVKNGWDNAAAEEVGKRVSVEQAQSEALRHIDNPYVSSQFSLLSRNLFAFVRAQEDWLRRWGHTIRDNPELIRKAQLLIHGGTSTGMVEKDDTGNLRFIYPGSSLILGAFEKIMPGAASLPVTGELSSQLMFLNPSLDNPVSLSGTPLLSLPLKALTSLTGASGTLFGASMDKVVNGQLGAGRQWWETMLPSWANRIIGGVISNDPGSKYGAAVASSIANLEAAGMLDNPEYQTHEGKARLLHALEVQTHNDLLMSTLLAFGLPAAPTYEGTADKIAAGFQGNKADWSAHQQGLASLKDEARQVFARLPYEQAKLWWTTVHPNESVLAPTGAASRTTVGANNASAPATIAAARMVEQNRDFFAQYGGKGGVAAYFIPQGPAGTVNGSYSDVAYRAQLELGIRDYKSLDDYFADVITSRGAAQYFAAKDAIDKSKSEVPAGSRAAKAIDDDWAQQKDAILAANPLLSAKFATSAGDNAAATSAVQSLLKMVEDSTPSTVKALGPNRDGVIALLQAKAAYDDAAAQLGTKRSNAALRAKQMNKDTYEATVLEVSTRYPGLSDLARGVFRLPN